MLKKNTPLLFLLIFISFYTEAKKATHRTPRGTITEGDIPYLDICFKFTDRSMLTDKALKKNENFDLSTSDIPSPDQTEAYHCDYHCQKALSIPLVGEKISELLRISVPVPREFKLKPGDIPPECFYASMLDSSDLGDDSRYHICKPLKPRNTPQLEAELEKTLKEGELSDQIVALGKAKGPSFCTTQAYTELLSKSFNRMADCFDLSQKEKNQMFALFHSKSRFMLNGTDKKREKFCYGQLTSSDVQNINRHIEPQNSGHPEYKKLYTEALSRCPHMKEKQLKYSKDSKPHETICGITEDPYTCLFYSMFSIKAYSQHFDKTYNKVPKYMDEKSAVSENIQKTFQLPILANEIISVKGILKMNGARRMVNWLFWDASEIHDTFKNIDLSVDATEDELSIKKLKVFNKDQLRAGFAQLGHKEGFYVIDAHLPIFLEKIKKQVADSANCHNSRACLRMRRQLLSGKSLDLDKLEKQWAKHSRSAGGQLEKISLSKVNRDLTGLYDGSPSKNLSWSKTVPSEIKDHFTNRIKKSCPKAVY